MPTHVALLRGINVGGHNKVAMSDLRGVVTSLGHGDVATYIQSGNVVFTASAPDAGTAALAAALEERIADELGVRPRVVVITRDELAHVVAANPYPDEADPKRLHAVFLAAAPSLSQVEAVATASRRAREQGGRDEVTVLGRTMYLRTPDGLGRSKLAAVLARPGTGAEAPPEGTARNWSTVLKLLALLDA
ncbi:DUF1697 domain-containing protein [Georgenia sp. SYP-B2076]|uniref:DUF1697 domain-containing protein n=1 Tax=Georgenia sp. SYP-B2076 TaxID=2495881 RepID=UPI000F8D2E80|nr:DUF1697 domain-containing protein [Georgenia sp. SYP-B2076]